MKLLAFTASLLFVSVWGQLSPTSPEFKAQVLDARKEAQKAVRSELLKYFKQENLQFADNPEAGLTSETAKDKLATELAGKIAKEHEKLVKATANHLAVETPQNVQRFLEKSQIQSETLLKSQVPLLVKTYFQDNVDFIESSQAKSLDLVKRFAMPAKPIRIIGGLVAIPLAIVVGVIKIIVGLLKYVMTILSRILFYIIPSSIRKGFLIGYYEISVYNALARHNYYGLLKSLKWGIRAPEGLEAFLILCELHFETGEFVNVIKMWARVTGNDDLVDHIEEHGMLDLQDKKVLEMVRNLQQSLIKDFDKIIVESVSLFQGIFENLNQEVPEAFFNAWNEAQKASKPGETVNVGDGIFAFTPEGHKVPSVIIQELPTGPVHGAHIPNARI